MPPNQPRSDKEEKPVSSFNNVITTGHRRVLLRAADLLCSAGLILCLVHRPWLPRSTRTVYVSAGTPGSVAGPPY